MGLGLHGLLESDCSRFSCSNVFLRALVPSTLRVCLGMLSVGTAMVFAVGFGWTF